jgi:membrane associated rhomboid family serine protease
LKNKEKEAVMGTAFWIKHFLLVLAVAFAIICGVQLLKGHDVAYSVTQGAIWGVIGAAIFCGARYRQMRKAQHCALCKDAPEASEGQ